MAAVIETKNLAEHLGEMHEPGNVLGSIALSLGLAPVAQARDGPGVFGAKPQPESAAVVPQSQPLGGV